MRGIEGTSQKEWKERMEKRNYGMCLRSNVNNDDDDDEGESEKGREQK